MILFAPTTQTAARAGFAGYVDRDWSLGEGRGFGSIVRRGAAPTPAPAAPTAANPGTRTAPVVIADLPTAPAPTGGFAAAVARRAAEPATPTPIIPVYVPPSDAFRGAFNGDPATVQEGEILSRTSTGRFVRTLPPPRGPGGQHFGTTADVDGRAFRAALNEQLQRVFPGETIAEHLGNPNRDTSILRGVGTVAAVAAPVAAIVAPYALPAVAAISAAANTSAAGGRGAGTAALVSGLTAGIGVGANALTSGASSMNANVLGTNTSPFGNLASGIANQFGASSDWANVIGGIGGVLGNVLGGRGGSSAPIVQAAPTAPPVYGPAPAPAPSSSTPLIVGGLLLGALLLMGGKRR